MNNDSSQRKRETHDSHTDLPFTAVNKTPLSRGTVTSCLFFSFFTPLIGGFCLFLETSIREIESCCRRPHVGLRTFAANECQHSIDRRGVPCGEMHGGEFGLVGLLRTEAALSRDTSAA